MCWAVVIWELSIWEVPKYFNPIPIINGKYGLKLTNRRYNYKPDLEQFSWGLGWYTEQCSEEYWPECPAKRGLFWYLQNLAIKWAKTKAKSGRRIEIGSARFLSCNGNFLCWIVNVKGADRVSVGVREGEGRIRVRLPGFMMTRLEPRSATSCEGTTVFR